MEDPFTRGEEILERARQISHDTDERLRKVIEKAKSMADTDPEVSSLPQDPTDEVPVPPKK